MLPLDELDKTFDVRNDDRKRIQGLVFFNIRDMKVLLNKNLYYLFYL